MVKVIPFLYAIKPLCIQILNKESNPTKTRPRCQPPAENQPENESKTEQTVFSAKLEKNKQRHACLFFGATQEKQTGASPSNETSDRSKHN